MTSAFTPSDIVINPSTVVPSQDIQTPLTIRVSGVTNVYVPFSATSLCSVELQFSSAYTGWVTCYLEKLTNPQNVNNLYALHFSIQKYRYFPGQPSSRSMAFDVTAATCNIFTEESSFSIIQSGCAVCEVTFDWGLYASSYTIIYPLGEPISYDDVAYTLSDLLDAGLGWDGKFYYDQAFTSEVHFGSDTANSSIIIYANTFEVIRFNVIDGQTQDRLNPAIILIDGQPADLLTCPEYQAYDYILIPPYSSKTAEFEVIAVYDGYNTKTGDYSFNTLDRHSILLEANQNPGEFTVAFEWSNRIDFDSYLQIFDSDMNLLLEDDVTGFITKPANLYYNSHQGDDGYMEESGYNAWLSGQGRTNVAYALIKKDGTFYELDYDYQGESGRDPVEHMTGKVNLSGNRIYRFMLNACSSDQGLAESNSKVTLTLENNEYVFYASEDKVYWTVFDIKKVNGIWSAVTIDEYSDMAQPGFIGCPGPGPEKILNSGVTSWDDGGEITEGITREFSFNTYSTGYEIDFNPGVTGVYRINIQQTEGAGYPVVGIYSGGTIVRSSGPNSEEVNINTTFRAQNTQTHTVKLVFWSGGVTHGKMNITITKEQ